MLSKGLGVTSFLGKLTTATTGVVKNLATRYTVREYAFPGHGLRTAYKNKFTFSKTTLVKKYNYKVCVLV